MSGKPAAKTRMLCVGGPLHGQTLEVDDARRQVLHWPLPTPEHVADLLDGPEGAVGGLWDDVVTYTPRRYGWWDPTDDTAYRSIEVLTVGDGEKVGQREVTEALAIAAGLMIETSLPGAQWGRQRGPGPRGPGMLRS